MFRKLRIAFSVVCGIVCLLSIVFWARSYWVSDTFKYFSFSVGHLFGIHSSYGVVGLGYSAEARFRLPGRSPTWRFHSQRIPNPSLTEREQVLVRKAASKQFRWTNRLPSSFGVRAPYWLMALLTMTIGVAPWLRFSLRTLLIATTLVALVLGAIVYAER
jgi:hypothetical protein